MDTFLTTEEVAARIGRAPRSVRQLCQSGRFDGAVKVGRDWLIPEAALLTFAPAPRGNPNWARRAGEAAQG